MGSTASKAASKGARTYPVRTSGESLAQASRPRAVPGAGAGAGAAPEPASEPTSKAIPEHDPYMHSESVPAQDEEQNPAFAERLRTLGTVRPNPLYSPSSTAAESFPNRPVDSSEVVGPDADMVRQMQLQQARYRRPAQNNTLAVLEARRRIQDAAAADAEDPRRAAGFLHASTIRDVLVLRARGVPDDAIEKRLSIKPGVVAELGPRGRFEAVPVPRPE